MTSFLYDTPVGQFSTTQNESGEWFLAFDGKLIMHPYSSLDELKVAVRDQKTGAHDWDELTGPKLDRHRTSADFGIWYDRRAL